MLGLAAPAQRRVFLTEDFQGLRPPNDQAVPQLSQAVQERHALKIQLDRPPGR